MTVIHGRSVASRKPTLRSHSVNGAAVPRVAPHQRRNRGERRRYIIAHRILRFLLFALCCEDCRRDFGCALVDFEGKDGNGRANLGAAESGTAVGGTQEHRQLIQRHVRDFELVVQMRERQRKAQQRPATKEPAKL